MLTALYLATSGIPAFAKPHAGYDALDAAHIRYPREWWRFEARVRASDGREFGTVTTFFRSAGDSRAKDSLSAVSAITDFSTGNRAQTERAGREALGNAHASPARLDTSVEAWSVRAIYDRSPSRKLFAVRAADGAMAASLDFSAPASPQISDARGYFVAGASGDSHFSAYTRASVSGLVTCSGAALNVTGSGWIDHVYGDATLALHPAWSLYEIQLDGGRDVLDYVQREAGGAQRSRRIVVDERGAPHVLPAETTTWRRGAGPYFWRSDRTHVVYPNLYHLVAAEFGIDVLVSPATAEQEIVPHGDAPYWDGAMDVVDFASAKKETGTGFAQLTGF